MEWKESIALGNNIWSVLTFSHTRLYREGKITLKQYRHFQGLKLAASRTKNKRRKAAILREYHLQERVASI